MLGTHAQDHSIAVLICADSAIEQAAARKSLAYEGWYVFTASFAEAGRIASAIRIDVVVAVAVTPDDARAAALTACFRAQRYAPPPIAAIEHGQGARQAARQALGTLPR